MIDHVGIRVPSLAAGRAVLRPGARRCSASPDEPAAGGGFVEWDGFRDRRGDRRAPGDAAPPHRLLRADHAEAVDAWWHALTRRGLRERRRARSTARLRAGVLRRLRPRSPRATASRPVNNGPRRHPGVIDHLWLRTRSLEDGDAVLRGGLPGRRATRSSATTAARRFAAPAPRSRSSRARRPRISISRSRHRTGRRWPPSIEAGVDAGFASNGEPGERPEYHPGYYGAFLTDPDGHNIEAVFHDR